MTFLAWKLHVEYGGGIYLKMEYFSSVKDVLNLSYTSMKDTYKSTEKKIQNLTGRIDMGVVFSILAQFSAATLTGVNLVELIKGTEHPTPHIIYSIGGFFLYVVARHNKDIGFLKPNKDEDNNFQKALNGLKKSQKSLEKLLENPRSYKT